MLSSKFKQNKPQPGISLMKMLTSRGSNMCFYDSYLPTSHIIHVFCSQVVKFNNTNLISDIRAFIRASRPDLAMVSMRECRTEG